MEQIRFEPLVTFSRAADHRRSQTGQNPTQDMFADMLGDQLQKRPPAERADLPVRRRASEQRNDVAEPLSGRVKKPIVLSNPKTLRGQAHEVDDTAQPRLARQPALIEQVDETTPATGAFPIVTADAGDSTDTPAQTADKEQTDETCAPMPCVIQAVEDEAPAVDADAALTAPEIAAPLPENEEAAPRAGDATTDDQANEAAAPTDDTATAAIAAATADADLAAALLALDTDGTAVTAAPNPNVARQPAQTPAAAAAAVAQNAIAEAEAPIVQTAATPAIPATPARPAAEPKPRAAGNSHTNPDAIKPGATPATPATPAVPAQPHLVAGAQANNPSEFTRGDGAGDQALDGGSGFGQGWGLHLAQGAASKRPDFVAQLKQHLQNLPAHEQVAIHVQRALREGTNRFSIQLSPSDLGRIQVKLEIDEEKRVTAVVSVEKPSTLELLQRDARGLERALQDAGLKLDGGNLSFSLSQSGDQEWARELERQGLGGSGAENTETNSVGEDTAAAASAVLDTAAGVADLQV